MIKSMIEVTKMNKKIIIEFELDKNAVDALCLKSEGEVSNEIRIAKCMVENEADDSNPE